MAKLPVHSSKIRAETKATYFITFNSTHNIYNCSIFCEHRSYFSGEAICIFLQELLVGLFGQGKDGQGRRPGWYMREMLRFHQQINKLRHFTLRSKLRLQWIKLAQINIVQNFQKKYIKFPFFRKLAEF